MSGRLVTVFYWLNVRTWIQLLILAIVKKDVKGVENIPRQGAFILASNHVGDTDPPFITAVAPRRIVWMAKQELFDVPVMGAIFRLLGLIPVRRTGTDLGALRKAHRELEQGHVLGVFPEGTRRHDLGMKEGEPGAAALALRTGAPVLPTAIWGSEKMRFPGFLLRRTRGSVRFGPPFRLSQARRPTREQITEGTDEIMRRIAELLPPPYRGVYADSVSHGTPAAG